MPHMPIISRVDTRQLYQYIYISYKLNAINTVTTSTGILTFHIIGISP